MNFIISPSESVLIGLCLEEYLQATQDFPETGFLDILPACLRPFVPDMRQFRDVPISEASLPSDVAEMPPGKIVISASTCRLFFKAEGQLFEQKVDVSRKSLIDLLVELLYPLLGKSRIEELAYCPRDDPNYTARCEQIKRELRNVPEEEYYYTATQRQSTDDKEDIEHRLVELVAHNSCEASFSVGRVIAGMRADSNRYEHYVRSWVFDADFVHLKPGQIDWTPLSPDEFVERNIASLERLRAMPPMASCRVSRLMIENELQYCRSGLRSVQSLDESGDYKATSQLAEIRLQLGILLGEVLGSLREADEEAYKRDAASATPRMFRLSPTSLQERVRGGLSLIQQEMNERLGTGMQPETIIAMLAHGIEAISQQVWPSEFAKSGARGSLSKVLDDKARSSDELESRFARVALMLYKQYRNLAEHHSAEFCCSHEEARFFVNGIRVLDDLARRIHTRKP